MKTPLALRGLLILIASIFMGVFISTHLAFLTLVTLIPIAIVVILF